ncbi:hypothetical protein ADICYQ_1774 [Cyclobacterium qasimii M12-11B]|uniref:Uncharacterized protein n=1 Tax=Cyclobacterium qasimii M12-11B TaxID=641524 RepID=S7WRC4_9BACT|nr:hypothetical protein ADICYQ_1774 [Cyclobacterium qasimii M12-11B]
MRNFLPILFAESIICNFTYYIFIPFILRPELRFNPIIVLFSISFCKVNKLIYLYPKALPSGLNTDWLEIFTILKP